MREFNAVVTRVNGDKVFLDQTVFHPKPYGGLDTDTGYLVLEGGVRVRVSEAIILDDDVAHVVEDPDLISTGFTVRGVIDWERRYNMMKLHTASHILAALLYKEYDARVTGGHIAPEHARDDFDLSKASDWRKALEWAVEETNRVIKRCIDVKVYWLDREKALSIPGIVKLAERLPPEVDRIRIVEIPGVDIQADGGPHVRNTCEIGSIKILRLESKGKKKRRLYYTLG